MFPLMIDLKGKKVVIVGGGKIAANKARVLATDQPDITFISPHFSSDIIELSNERGYTMVQRKAMLDDLTEAMLVILATNDRETNRTLAQLLPPQQLVCVVDEATDGNVLFPASFQRGYLQIAVSSNGASPKLTRMLKKQLSLQFDESWDMYTEFLWKCRQMIKGLPLSAQEKSCLLEEILDERYRIDEQIRTEKLEQLRKLNKTTENL
ncbi:NAD(P)-dependent oxidoreductase [Bacillus sp. B15-48]|uniref:NAD(P)-dependent oxidoreductase n=1 Tax=Bacillus sp. B15-48 TaxID=1548601 RepID=UPI00193F98A9|nr:NAD(P)-dependent oxidoreductase [Bacillus sp. B15-48]MBM4762826.1 potassium transporter Trk [Bacillus sp. B15-48]